ncbi:flagellar protein FlgN [Brevibacillus sp. H7]|uniref:flagellar protein FlgN n=1 Tax=Brevibacillus sp. H7 TaxID=3349138 RepID=UPI003800C014
MTKLKDLYGILDNLLNLHRALYTLAVQKKDVLIKNEVDELIAITQQEQKLIKAVGAAEAARIEAVKGICTEKGVPLSEASLAELIKLTTGAEEKARLTNYRNELIRIVSELREANDLNQQLLEQSLSFVNKSLDLITDNPADDFIYSNPAADAYRNPKRTFFNKKA